MNSINDAISSERFVELLAEAGVSFTADTKTQITDDIIELDGGAIIDGVFYRDAEPHEYASVWLN